MPNWVYWAVPVVVVAGLLWYLLGNRVEQVTQQPMAPVQSIVVGGVDIGKQLDQSLGDLRSSLAGITDVTSATAALPMLRAAVAQIDKVGSLAGQLSADQRKVVAGLVTPAMSSINQLLDKVLAIPGVGEMVKPTVETLRTRLADLSGQSSTVGGR
jgi:hypothetical protein